MYYDDISIKDVYKAMESIKEHTESINAYMEMAHVNNDIIVNEITDISSSVKLFESGLSKEIEYLSDVLICLLNEVKKTNLLSNNTSKVKENIKVVPFDLKKHINRSLLVVNDSFLVAQEYARDLAKQSDKKLEIINTYKVADITPFLLNADVNDYIVINYNKLFNDGVECLLSALFDDEINITVRDGATSRTIEMGLKPINYIIYSEKLELLDQRLIEELDIVT